MRSMALFTFTARPLAILLIFLLSASPIVTARPCKTLLISSYSFALRRLPNPNPNPRNADLPYSSGSSSRFFTVFTTTTFTAGSNSQFNRKPAFIIDDRRDFMARYGRIGVQIHDPKSLAADETANFFPNRSRSKDMLSVVMALLFGVGCGALTALTMYMVWSLLPSNRAALLAESDDEYDYDDESPKKVGYVKIPAPEASPVTSKA